MKTQETPSKAQATENPEFQGKTMVPPAFSLDAGPADGGGGEKKPKDLNKEPKKGIFTKTAEFDGPMAEKGEGDGHAFAPNDVRQGGLGDCTFLAAMISMANVNPQKLEDLICANGDGTFEVTLAVPVEEGGFEWETVKVKPDFVVDGKGEPKFARGQDQKELWPMLFEKAFAQCKGRYRGIIGVDSKLTMSSFTGVDSNSTLVYEETDEDLLDLLLRCVKNHVPITAGSTSKVAYDRLPDEVNPDWIIESHEYAILSANRAAKSIVLRNPWDFNGEFEVSLANFRRFIVELTYGPNERL